MGKIEFYFKSSHGKLFFFTSDVGKSESVKCGKMCTCFFYILPDERDIAMSLAEDILKDAYMSLIGIDREPLTVGRGLSDALTLLIVILLLWTCVRLGQLRACEIKCDEPCI